MTIFYLPTMELPSGEFESQVKYWEFFKFKEGLLCQSIFHAQNTCALSRSRNPTFDRNRLRELDGVPRSQIELLFICETSGADVIRLIEGT